MSPAPAKAALTNVSKSLAQSRVGMRKDLRTAPSSKRHSATPGTSPKDGRMFVGGAVGSAGASLAWEFDGWAAVCTFGVALVAVAVGLHACGRVAENSWVENHATQRPRCLDAFIM